MNYLNILLLFKTLKYDCSFSNSTSDTDNNEEAQFKNLSNNFQISENDQINQILLQHQRHITIKYNISNYLNGN